MNIKVRIICIKVFLIKSYLMFFLERPDETMESKAWGQPINPVTRMVDFGRQRLFYKLPEKFLIDPNVQRYTGKYSLEGTEAAMVKPTTTDLWQPEILDSEDVAPMMNTGFKFGGMGGRGGKYQAGRPRAERLMMAGSRTVQRQGNAPVYTNSTGSYLRFEDTNNRMGRGWSSNQNSYNKYQPDEQFEMFGMDRGQHPSESEHDLHQMYWGDNSYLDDIEILEYPSSRTSASYEEYVSPLGRRGKREIPEEYAHLFENVDEADVSYLCC